MKIVLGILLAFTMLFGMASPALGMMKSSSSPGQNPKAQPAPPIPWSVSVVDDSNSPAWRTSIAIDSSNRPHISYFTWGGYLMYASWTGSAWEKTTLQVQPGKKQRWQPG
jgi:hypothetical protein